ncbi:hypothetical protein BMS_2728 [Halobacteriovorax marinus SJ]|uniref:Uncharacterized protein n=1 Tax=Halobacteriovorax marinus (strain ATCC BAA-682 / DSM 15412 / SJ) TaxID=862908 RepID=E1WXI8_HALMS|nr:hypothetical protein [Halobacteriovorax marinus]CBW27505.1 hypothetical protein BMS_2728 [Halobacteriovorax marinus SJ]
MATQAWKIERDLLLSNRIKNYSNHFVSLGYYDLVYVEVDEEDNPLINSDGRSFSAFTSKELAWRSKTNQELEDIISNKIPLATKSINLKSFMIGDLAFSLSSNTDIRFIKINPILFTEQEKTLLLHEEVLIIPIKDELTSKHILTSADESMALLAIKPNDEKRMGMELVFYCLTTKNLPDDLEEKERVLNERIAELSFYSSRVPIKKGSSSILCVIVNLENSMEETAFIRNYKTMDKHSDVIFVTSDLKIKTGDLEVIPYNGESIDTVFMPIINWQNNHRSPMQSTMN